MYSNDEMRLTYVIIPMLQTMIAVAVVVLLTIHNWRSKKIRRE
ncbi:MAG TPA: hypothetical protein VGY57_00900 [Vicinamibacterales bacterium]|jgi:hypothetical protein|nr:hypothetical protein [Vicinamibacterales bacterium]